MQRNIYLALGDSVTVGHGATHPNMSFIYQFGSYSREKSLADQTIVIAQNGWTSGDVFQATHFIDKTIWDHTNLLTLMTGGNDLRKLLRRLYLPLSRSPITPELVNQRLQEFGFHLNLLCRSISYHNIPFVLVATVYNPVPNFPLAVNAIESLNDIVRDMTKHYNFELVDVYNEFQKKEFNYIEGYRTGRFEDLVSPFRRPIHPSNTGHRRIADLFTKHLSFIERKKRSIKH